MDLAGLDILVTRPEPVATDFCATLEGLGAHSYSVPAMIIEPLLSSAEIEAIKAKVMQLDAYRAAIFISQNAVSYGAEYLDQYWVDLPMDTQFFAIGKKTAIMLEREISPRRVKMATGDNPAMDSESLLALPELVNLKDQKVLIFRGVGGRETLAKTLRERGAIVDYCELYKRSYPCELAKNIAASGFDQALGQRVITAQSGESLANLDTAIDAAGLQHWRKLPVLVPSARVAELASSLGFEKVLALVNPAEQTILEALQNLRR